MSLDPRTRLVMLVLVSVVLAATSSRVALGAALVGLALGALLAHQGRVLPAALRVVMPLGVLVFALSFVGVGFEAAVAGVLRLAALVTASLVLFASTTPEDMAGALVSGGLPYPAAFVLGAATGFVPQVARRAAAVRDAQRARGLPLDTGLAGLRHAPALFLPVLAQSFALAEELAEAMESRGFSRPGRTFRRTYRLTRLDWAVVAAALGATAAYLRWGGP